jgi:DNA polymerase IV
MTDRKIIHVDMDAFYASVEQRDDPALRGRPVVVAWRGARSVVCAASYEARRFGVRSAMPALRAERLCPEAVFVPPDFTRYKAASRAVREIMRRHTDLIEPLSLDEAYLDVTANKTGLPTATRVASTIRAQIREELKLTASAGVAPNKFLAKIASDMRKPDGLFVIQPAQVEAFLTPLPVGRIPGVGKVMDEKLALLGVRTSASCVSCRWPSWSVASASTGGGCTSSRAASMSTRCSRISRRGRSPQRTRSSTTFRWRRWTRRSSSWRRKSGPHRSVSGVRRAA